MYTLHGVTLETVYYARYLVVDIANDLSWKTHVTRIAIRPIEHLDSLANNSELREKAYKTIVKPQLEYAAPFLDPHTKDDI